MEPSIRRPSQRSARLERMQRLQEACHLVLRVTGNPNHYQNITRMVREHTSLTPTNRQVLYALRIMKSQGLVRCVRVGVYECATPSHPAGEKPTPEAPAGEGPVSS